MHVPQEAKGGNTEAAVAEAAVGVGVGGAAVGVGVGGAPQPDLQVLSLLALLVQKYRY